MSEGQIVLHVRHAPTPMLLMRVPSGKAVELSADMSRLIGRERVAALGTTAPEYTDDPDATRLSLQMLAQGRLKGYTRRVRMPTPAGEPRLVDVAVQAWGPTERRLAVATVWPVEIPRATITVEPPSPAAPLMGTADGELVVDRIVGNDSEPLTRPASTVLGTNLVSLMHEDDEGVVRLLAAHCRARTTSVSGQVRLRSRTSDAAPGRLTMRLLAKNPTAPLAGYAFAWNPEPATRSNGGTAAESFPARLDPQGIRPTTSTWPHIRQRVEIGELTPRELDVVARLVSGQRVGSIAAELFISQSTVRNHLTAVYRKFDVASQAELLESLRVG